MDNFHVFLVVTKSKDLKRAIHHLKLSVITLTKRTKKSYPQIDEFSHIRFAPDGGVALVAPARAKKPTSLEGICIFCPDARSNLAEPYSGMDLAEMNRRGVYILDNAYPVTLPRESELGIDRRFAHGFGGVFYDWDTAVGRHLVMIETPNHKLNPFSKSRETASYYKNLVWGYIQMLKSLREEGFRWGSVGKNRNGKFEAGASQEHLHSQALAANFDVTRLDNLVRLSGRHEDNLIIDGLGYTMHEVCSACKEVRDNRFYNRKAGRRLFEDDSPYVSFVAPVPRGENPYHFEVRIAPLSHQSHFEDMTPEQADAFAVTLHKNMEILGRRFPNLGFNYILWQGPWKAKGRDDIRNSHWEFSIYPSSSKEYEKHTGFIPHLLGAPVLKSTPEQLAREIIGYQRK